MSTITFKPSDWSKQVAMLRQLPDKIGDKVIIASLQQANEAVEYAAYQAAKNPSKGLAPSAKKKSYAKRLKGDLAKSITVKVKKYGNSFVWGGVGAARPAGAHSYIVEKGHRVGTGGTLKPTHGDKPAPIQKRGRWYSIESTKGGKSGQRKMKALFRYLGKQGASVDQLTRELEQWKASGFQDEEASKFVKGAMRTKAIYKKLHGIRGMGKEVGLAPGYPFLEPTFNAQAGTIAKVFELAVENETNKLLGKIKT